MRAVGAHVFVLLGAVGWLGCGDGNGATSSGLRPADPQVLQRFERCFPSCFAAVMAQQGCAAEGACVRESGRICYGNGIRYGVSSANGVVETRVYGVDGALCYRMQVAADGKSTLHDGAGNQAAEIVVSPVSGARRVICGGKSHDIDLESPDCMAANAIPGAEGGCATGTCPAPP